MPTRSVQTTDGWWHTFFRNFRPFFDTIPAQTTKAETRACISYLGLKRGQSFLDCPCGIGRIAIPLAQQGIKVTGVDFKQEYLDELQIVARRRRLKITTLRADMRRISFDSQFDAAGNLWTSFGFFEKEADNLLVLRKMYCALKPGGKFLLHVINRDWLMKHYQPEGMHKSRKVNLYEQRVFDFTTSINHTRCIIDTGAEEFLATNHLRLYSLHELIAMLGRVGFAAVAGYGGYHSEPVTLESRMLYVTGRKPQE